MIRVRFKFGVASIDDGVWRHDNLAVVRLLNATRPVFGVSGAEPDRDYALAEVAVAELGGEILSERPQPDSVPGRIY